MLIPEHKIEELRERVDIVALISRYVELKKSGRSYKGRCPFHQEKTASFYVTPEMRIFKCFGCQAGGDAIAFVQRYLGKTFTDAVKDLAREAGVNLEAAVDPAALERQQLKEVTDLAAEHFRARLQDPERGSAARRYLAGRGVTEEVTRTFGLGWAPAAWSDLTDVLLRAGMIEWGEKAGLVKRRERGEGYYDTFRGRLIIPIRSAEGRTIAFGGRLLEGDDGPKYLNSRESLLYNKSETLYGLDQARDEIRRRKTAVLVEGYFDCIGLHQVGVKHAVALCSTALTAGHLSTLSRAEAKELVLLLDGDEAGRKAVERLAGPLLARGALTRVALLPEGEDPDTYARKVGVTGVDQLLAAARPLSEHLFSSLLSEGRAASFELKMQAIDRLKPITAQLPVGLTRSAFFAALAAHTGLPAVELEAALRGKAPPPRPSPKPAGLPPQGTGMEPAPPRPRPPQPERPPDNTEALFAAAALRDPTLLTRDTFRIADELSHPGLRALIAYISAGNSPEDALFEAPEALKRAIENAGRQLLATTGVELEQAFAAICQKLKLDRIEAQLSHNRRAGQEAQARGDAEEIGRLQAERNDLVTLRERVRGAGQGVTGGTKTGARPV